MDTANKRASSLFVFLPWRVYPAPDGSGDQADRQHAAFAYAGILADAVSIPPPNPYRPRAFRTTDTLMRRVAQTEDRLRATTPTPDRLRASSEPVL